MAIDEKDGIMDTGTSTGEQSFANFVQTCSDSIDIAADHATISNIGQEIRAEFTDAKAAEKEVEARFIAASLEEQTEMEPHVQEHRARLRKLKELKDKWGSSELKIEKLKRGHQEIKGNPITSLYYQNWYKEFLLLTEKQIDIEQKIREILESVTGLK